MVAMHIRKTLGLGLVTALLALGCGGRAAQEQQQDTQPLGGTEERAYRGAYGSYAEEVREGLASGLCKVDRECGALAFVNCGIEVDGPGYYVDSRSGQVLEVCGGACMLPREGFCVACPPPEWTCAG